MKKKTFIYIGSMIVVAIILVWLLQPWGKQPFKDLSVNEISSVSVQLLPPDETYDLNEKEIIQLLNTLNKVVIYNKDSSYNEYVGQAVIYSITKTDGSKITVNAYNPFIIFDGMGYKAKYEPCEELNALGNRIRNNE